MKTLTRAGAFWKDADGNRYVWDDDAQLLRNEETGEIAVPIAFINDDEILAG